MVVCGNERRFYMLGAAGIAKIIAAITGGAPVILSIILHDHYTNNERLDTPRYILIQNGQRAVWELAFFIVVASALGITVLNLLFYTIFECLSSNIWTKRFDCGYLALSGMAQTVVGFIMVASALTTHEYEPVELKYAAGFLGIATGIVYWAAATLVNRD